MVTSAWLPACTTNHLLTVVPTHLPSGCRYLCRFEERYGLKLCISSQNQLVLSPEDQRIQELHRGYRNDVFVQLGLFDHK